MENSQFLRQELKINFPEESLLLTGGANTPIIPFLTGEPQRTLQVSQHLKENGIFVPAIRPPTVPKGECRLRFSLSSEHSRDGIQTLLKSLGRVFEMI